MRKDNDRLTRQSSIASGWTVEGQPETAPHDDQAAGGQGDPRAESIAEGVTRQVSSGALVLFGLLGGLFLLWSYSWFTWARVVSENTAAQGASGTLDGVLQQIVIWVAPFAPVLWFVTVFVLCRGAKPLRIALWLLVGLVLLVPLPMFWGMF